MLVLHKIFQKIDEERTLSNLFYEASITLISKPDYDITRKLQTNIPYEYMHQNSQQNPSTLNPTTYEKIVFCDWVGFILGLQSLFNI